MSGLDFLAPEALQAFEELIEARAEEALERRLGERRGHLLDALDRLLLQCFGSKVGRSLGLQLTRRQRNNWTQVKFWATPVLTGHTEKDETFAETGDNGQVQTNV